MNATLSLNSQQKKAVDHIEGPLLVLAGAGSGKTHVVTQRIAHLINVGVPPSEIVALTFTNKAAQEMQFRVRNLCSQNVLTCTFHSLCARMLRESIHHLEFKNDFTIYDQSDSENLLKSCIKSLNIEVEKSLVRSFKTAISNAKNELVSPQDLASETEHKNVMLYNVYSLYQKHLKEYNALDFDDLLFLTVDLLRKFPEIKEQYQARWTFFLIDEYQDTNQAQYALAKLLTEKNNNIFVVGDPDQSIYSFRGANIQNILNFKRDFPGAVIIPLEQNYRTTSHILSGANHLISYNQKRYEKALWSDLGEGEKIKISIADSEREEAMDLMERIKDYSQRFSLNEMVIFYRTNSQSRIYEDLLLRNKIPYQIIGGLSFYARKEIKDILCFLRIVHSSNDYIAFERTINLPRRGFGATTLAKIKSASQAQNLSIYETCKAALHSTLVDVKLTKRQLFGLEEYIKAIDYIRALKDLPIAEIIKEVLSQFRYLDFLKLDEETFIERKSNVDELISKAVEWEEDVEEATLAKFLEELTLKAQLDDHNLEEEKIKLMTIHNSKGLEFPVVFVVGMEEDLFPHINSKEDGDQLEEERRLAYVAITRAKRHIYLSAARYRLIWGTPRTMKPSRFLNELPSEHVEILHKECEEIEDPMSDELMPGTVVNHKSFGKGVIKKSYQTSLGLTYDVYFPTSESMKTLIAKYAKLEVFRN
ncbi:MAG: UvrD-helicase domain-containing protein [Rhabdochlamydiaceae bacterium]|nr:UvrD-helicase domain-containing protein [Candidatus Amphrikana amoebophyrae]